MIDKRYLSTYFFIDLIPIIPYGYVWRAHSDLTALEYQAGEFFILLRIVRIYSVHQYFMQAAERFRFSSIAKRLSEYVKYKQVPLELEKRLVEFYRYCFRQNFYREPAILEFLSGQLRQKTILFQTLKSINKTIL
ncbi:uncharacterized protein GBIM_03648, partial [Gryllus bimaculatus]